jgi:hypothetical protein
MRATLTLDDDLARRLADLAHESGRPFKAVVNETLRKALAEAAPSEPPFQLQPHPGHLKPGIDDRRFNELAWETE